MDAWFAAHPRDGYGLLVLHTHPHGDHVAGDVQFAGRPDTLVVDAGQRSRVGVLRICGRRRRSRRRRRRRRGQLARVDLGGRVLLCWPSPGHHSAAVTFYDPYTGVLLTGDTVYPGRLYIHDWPAFVRTIDRLLAFCAAHPVSHVLGCHIEMSREPGVDYPIYTTYQPDEPPLQLTVEQLRELRRAIDVVDGRPGRHVFPGFILCLERSERAGTAGLQPSAPPQRRRGGDAGREIGDRPGGSVEDPQRERPVGGPVVVGRPQGRDLGAVGLPGGADDLAAGPVRPPATGA